MFSHHSIFWVVLPFYKKRETNASITNVILSHNTGNYYSNSAQRGNKGQELKSEQ